MKYVRQFGNRKANKLSSFKSVYGKSDHTDWQKSPRQLKKAFDRSQLLDPLSFYHLELPDLSGRSDWRLACCPFHEDRHPSFSVNIESGGYYCHACGAKGRDILDFYMQRYSVSFTVAAKALGAWKDE